MENSIKKEASEANKHSDWLETSLRIWSKVPVREAVIVCMALIEREVFIILNALLADVKQKKQTLEKLPFKNKIKLLYFLGLIDFNHREIFFKMNTIRNKFAHYVEIEDFKHPTIIKLMMKVKKYPVVNTWLRNFDFGADEVTLEDEFKAVTTYLFYFSFQQRVKPIKIEHDNLYYLLQGLKDLSEEKKLK